MFNNVAGSEINCRKNCYTAVFFCSLSHNETAKESLKTVIKTSSKLSQKDYCFMINIVNGSILTDQY